MRQRRLQRRLLERRQLSGIELRDRRRFGRNGAGRHSRQHGAEGRRQRVPRRRLRQLRRRRHGPSDNCGSPGVGQPCSRPELAGDVTYNTTNNFLTNVSATRQELGLQPERRRSDRAGQGLVLRDLSLLGREQDGGRQLFRRRPVAVHATWPDPSRPGIDDGHIRSIAGRVTAQVTREGQDVVLPRRAGQGARALGDRRQYSPGSVGNPGDADQLHVGVEMDAHARPTSCCSRPASAVYDQQYQEIYQPSTSSPARSRSVTLVDNSTNKNANAWNNPADHFSKLFTEQFAASYVTGAHSMRFGADDQPGEVAAGPAMDAATSSRSPITACCRTATSIRSA